MITIQVRRLTEEGAGVKIIRFNTVFQECNYPTMAGYTGLRENSTSIQEKGGVQRSLQKYESMHP